eukprot:6888080-Pyramimonas_sp.AAC.1
MAAVAMVTLIVGRTTATMMTMTVLIKTATTTAAMATMTLTVAMVPMTTAPLAMAMRTALPFWGVLDSDNLRRVGMTPRMLKMKPVGLERPSQTLTTWDSP